MERKEREQKEMDQELLKQRIVQDQKVIIFLTTHLLLLIFGLVPCSTARETAPGCSGSQGRSGVLQVSNGTGHTIALPLCHQHCVHTQAHHRGKLDQEKTENRDYIEQNLSLLRVEEDQFREYSNQVIKEAKNRGAPTYALRAAARSGAGLRVDCRLMHAMHALLLSFRRWTWSCIQQYWWGETKLSGD